MPSKRTTPAGYMNARRLRQELTPAETTLWAHLRANKFRGVSFRRQHAIDRYVVDFCSPRHRLIIELDGSAHLGEAVPDGERTAALERRGYRVLRFWNHQVANDIEGVLRAILDALTLA